MIRFILAVAIAICLSPSQSYAQSQRFIVTSTSASIYQAPNVGSLVIGHSLEGAALDVRRELLGWIEVAWPTAAKGIAYVRAATGSIEKPGLNRAAPAVQRPMTIDEYVHGTSAAQAATSPAASGSTSPSAGYVADAVAAVSAGSTARQNVTTTNATYAAPTHFVGLGGRVGNVSTNFGDLATNIGATGRVWSRNRVGVQFEMFRDARTNAATAQRVASLQVAPSVLYALPNAVSDYFWLRPYVGGGATIGHSTLRSTNSLDVSSSSHKALGIQMFGGGEVTFAGVPRFALSADVGYQKARAGFAGFERRRLRFALSGHWFVR